jgi:RNA polymerase sigma-70 factor (ECF subfamily)
MPAVSLDNHRLALLVRRMRDHDAEALAELYDRTASLVYGLALRVLRVPEDAEEVTTDVYSHAWRSASRYDPARATVQGWLVMLTRSRAIDRLRARRVRVDTAGLDLEGVDPPSRELAPDARLDQEVRARHVRTALDELAPHERTLIELAFFEGLTHSELADRLGLPLGTVKTRIRSGLQKLRRAMVLATYPATIGRQPARVARRAPAHAPVEDFSARNTSMSA